MKSSPGFFSMSSFFSSLITLLIVAGTLYTGGGSMFSSGTLSSASNGEVLGGVSSHAEIGGNCEACHTAPWDAATMADRCVDCHASISVELDSSISLHGVFLRSQNAASVTSAQEKSLKCNTCHPEHHGPQAPLVEMDLTTFPHDNFKFSLRAHQQKTDASRFACADCHAGNYANSFDFSTCVNCHYIMQADFTQTHALEYDLRCLNCHDGLETYGSEFDHNLFPFALTGKHVQAACAGCHQRAHTALADLRFTPQDCYSCHQQNDSHNGQLGTKCEACHSSTGWDQAHVDHSLFVFPLTGKHVDVVCESCHQNKTYKDTPQDCYSCHRNSDKHGGQLGTNCAACHATSGWMPASFDHNLSVFKLTGAHTNTACTSCHQNGIYKGTPQDCYSCHRSSDKHGGQFGTNCASCHTTSTWKGAAFDHNLAAFKLTGSHVNTACASCHVNGVYKGTPQDCYSCHRSSDKHGGQFGTNCAGCHTTSTWKGAAFDHNLAAFKLTGSHVNTACASCHVNGVFKGTPQDCYSCHRSSDKHGGQFGTNCAGCHTTSAWKGAAFDHNLAAFKLTGMHVNTACTGCHQNGVYKGTPQDCYSCHRNSDKHGGQFGTNCASCHSTSTWKGATFNHNSTGFPLTGRHVSLACERCHAGGRFSGTPAACSSCHSDPAFHSGMFGTNCASCHSTNNWSATYRGSHPGIADEGGSGVNHGHTSCRTCHTSNLHSAVCTACHDGNEGGGDGGGGEGDDD